MSTSKQKIAVFPGSFDPITKGHEAIVKRALPLFDKVIIAIGNNTEKQIIIKNVYRPENGVSDFGSTAWYINNDKILMINYVYFSISIDFSSIIEIIF